MPILRLNPNLLFFFLEFYVTLRSVPSVARNRNVEMPRAGESQLSLSVRQEGGGAMRMLLRAAYNLTHELEKFSCVVHPGERRSLPIYRRNDSLQSAISPRTFMHCTTCLTTVSSVTPFYIEQTKCTFSPAVYPSTAGLSMHLDSGTNPFPTRLRSLKRKTSSFFVHALARGQDGVNPSVYALSSLYSTPCAFRLTYFSPAPTMMWSRS